MPFQPFEIAVPDPALEDLRQRLRGTRWPQGVTDSGGISLGEMRALAGHWANGFDWRARERELNALPQWLGPVEGTRIHFVHLRSPRADALPLLLLHGWPGSFVEMVGLVRLLGDRFHVVVPSLPGYGFSEVPTAAGMSNARMAELCRALMAELGYERFLVQGGDWGAGIGTWIARQEPARVIGLHLNYIPGSYTPALCGSPTADEFAFLRECDRWAAEDGAYGHVQRTRPLTLAYGLADSPAGLAAWIVEKFREWADPRSPVPIDALLTNATVYWVTNTIGSSMRLYLEASRTPHRFADGERVGVPCAIARFPYEAPFPPRSWIERGYDVVRWSELPRGGHFAALEEPALLAEDLIGFADALPFPP